MTGKFERGRVLAMALMAGNVLGGAALVPGMAAAQDQAAPRGYDIPAGSLTDALNRFAEQSGVQLTYEAALTQGRQTSGLRGSFAPHDALARLLSGTGLTARPSSSGALTIARATTGAMTLDPLRMELTQAAYGTAASAEGGEDDSWRRDESILVTGHNEQIDARSASGPWGSKLVIDTPYAISTVSQDLIESVVASDMDQLFKMNPVVQNSAPSTVYGTPYVTIRGFDSQKGVVDGVRLSSTLTGIATEELANVEIMNGLSGFLYGVGNPGGVTNYVLKRPTAKPAQSITLGNYGKEQFFAHIDLGGPIDGNGTFGYRLNLSHQDGDTSKKNQHIARTLVSGAIDWNVSPDLLVQVEAAHTYYRIDGIDSRFYAYANAGYGALGHWIEPLAADKSWTPDWTFLQVKTDRIGANVKWQLNDSVSLRTAYLYKRDAQESINVYPAYFADSGWQVGWASRSGPSYNIAQGAYGYLDANFETLGIAHHLTVGASGDILRVKEHRDGNVSFGNSPSFSDPNGMMSWAMPDLLKTTPWGPLYKSSQSSNLNIVIGDDIRFTEQLSLMVGINRSTVKATSYPSEADSPDAPTRYDESAYTPTVSLVFKPVPRVTTYATYMEGLEQGDIIDNDPTFANPGQILKPFVSKQYEVGAKYAPIDALLITGALYRIEKANSFTEVNSDGLFVVTQDGTEVHQGLEFTVTGHVTPNLNVMLGGTVMDLKVTKTDTPSLLGKKPTGVSDTLAKIYLDYSLPWVPGLSVSGGAFHNGTMYKDSANLQKIEGSTIFDLGLHYATEIASHPVRFDLNVANLTNRNYWATSYSLGIPRNVAFSVKFSL